MQTGRNVESPSSMENPSDQATVPARPLMRQDSKQDPHNCALSPMAFSVGAKGWEPGMLVGRPLSKWMGSVIGSMRAGGEASG